MVLVNLIEDRVDRFQLLCGQKMAISLTHCFRREPDPTNDHALVNSPRGTIRRKEMAEDVEAAMPEPFRIT